MAPKKRKAADAKAAASKKAAKKQEAESESDEDEQLEGEEKVEEGSTNPSSEEQQSDETTLKTKDGRPWNFKATSWNVSGIRAWLKKDGMAYFEKENPDIFTLQETKCAESDIPQAAKEVAGYHTYWSHQGTKSGYAGVGLFTKKEPIKVDYGIGIEKHDEEGRLLTAEYDEFYFVAVYVPNSSRGLVRLPYRREWNSDFLAYLKRLDSVKPVIVAGDLNVAHQPIDLARPQSNTKSAGFTKEERDDFTALLNSGFVDTFRHLHPDKKDTYTFWSYMNNARAKNVGWRLDYFLVSERLADDLCDSVMRSKVLGSDHCPLTLFMSMK